MKIPVTFYHTMLELIASQFFGRLRTPCVDESICMTCELVYLSSRLLLLIEAVYVRRHGYKLQTVAVTFAGPWSI